MTNTCMHDWHTYTWLIHVYMTTTYIHDWHTYTW
jgi:hypothetical protein